MKNIFIVPEYRLQGEGAEKAISITSVMRLLLVIEHTKNMRKACLQEGISYRLGWNLVANLQNQLGALVIDSSPGRGTNLTDLGQRLVWAQRRTEARLGPLLDSMASEISEDIALCTSRSQRVIRLYASHGFAVASLYEQLYQQQVPIELSYRGSHEALESFHRQGCELAGFHVPLGPLQETLYQRVAHLLLGAIRLIQLATRRLGLMVARGNPKNIWAVSDLARAGVRFVNRQPGSGTRAILELLLKEHRINPQSILGFNNVELTHAAIGAYIASGKADVGLGVETGAKQFDLDFVPLLTERYFLVCQEGLFKDPRFIPIYHTLKSPIFHAQVNQISGYDAQNTGMVLTVKQAFGIKGDALNSPF